MIVTNNAAETRALGERLAEQLKAGDVILQERASWPGAWRKDSVCGKP